MKPEPKSEATDSKYRSAAAAPTGLTEAEAARRLRTLGPNALPDATPHLLVRLIEKFWAPIPCLLEASILLQLVLGKFLEAAIISALLVFNAAIGFFQEGRAQATLKALKSRLALNASVYRDGTWKTVAAADLVEGDVVKLSLGGVVAADVRLMSGEVLIDQSMLTGESAAIEAGAGARAFAGALVRRGDATGEVTATGPRTKFGRTAELIRMAHVVSSQQKAVLSVVQYLAMFNGLLIIGLVIYAVHIGMPAADIVPLVLTAVLASIPVALPATFTLASALGAAALAKKGVLPTRLSAVDEAGTMDVLCVDKTGTLTCNALTVMRVDPMPGFDASRVLALAAMASSDAGQDPVEVAIRTSALRNPTIHDLRVLAFTPFDPASKMAAATVTSRQGDEQRILKGAISVIAAQSHASPDAMASARDLEKQGFRVLAVATGAKDRIEIAGLIALSDPPRPESAALVAELALLGVRTVMVTGDAAMTAATVAALVGIPGAVCPQGGIQEGVQPAAFAVFADVLPEDKYRLVTIFQKSGHTVGMCGDGANDAPALRQAQIGIAVSTATDVAKSAAGMVLTDPGLAGIVSAVKEGRWIFQRVLTYTLNSLTKKAFQVLLLVFGLLMTGHAVLTPLLMVIIMVTGDFLGMSLTTDNVRPSQTPNSWRIRRLMIAGVVMGLGELMFCAGILSFGLYALHLGLDSIRTLAFITVVFGNQATTYTNRERKRLWSSRPSNWVLACSVGDLTIASILALTGIAMTSLPLPIIALTLVAAMVFALVLDCIKVPLLRRLAIT